MEPPKPSLDDGPPTKRQKREAPKAALRELSADKFLEKISLYTSAMVTVRVDKKDFILPKGLLCYNSNFFDRAFNGFCIEATQNYITLPRCSSETFELIIQWIYQSQIILPAQKSKATRSLNTDQQDAAAKSEISNKDSQQDSDGEEPAVELDLDTATLSPRDKISWDITRLLTFLKVADRILLVGPFSQVIDAIRKLVSEDRLSITAQHIRAAAELPSGHGTRKLFAQACVKNYIDSLLTKTPFRFATELEEVEPFTSDLLKEFNPTFLRKEKCRTGYNRRSI